MDDINKIIELLPLLIPLIIAELAVLGYTLSHIFTHSSYKRGNRVLWTVISIVFMNTFIGPILYFVLGKEDS